MTMGDGRVDNITSQRGVLGDDDRIAGLRVDTKKENGLDAPGLMASGFNHVLTRLSGVYNVPGHDEIEAKSDAENDNKHLERNMLLTKICLLYTSPSPRDQRGSRMPSSA